jgi:hypothetical protein
MLKIRIDMLMLSVLAFSQMAIELPYLPTYKNTPRRGTGSG